MLLSMTGFGRGEATQGELHVVAEVRSVNNRFLDIVARLPKAIAGYEQEVKELVRSQIGRGRINVSVTIQAAELEGLGVRVDMDVARSYTRMLSEIVENLNLEGGVRLEHLLNFSDIFRFRKKRSLPRRFGTVRERQSFKLLKTLEKCGPGRARISPGTCWKGFKNSRNTSATSSACPGNTSRSKWRP